MTRPGVLLDRDGTLIEERHYLRDPDSVVLLPGAVAGLRRLADLGLPVALVSNQSGIGQGLFGWDEHRAVMARLAALLAAEGLALAGAWVCPHLPSDACACRKPAPGLARAAAAALDLDPARSFVVGDKACDVGLAAAWGARGLLVRTGYGARTEADAACAPAAVVDDLDQAARWIEQARSSAAS